MEYVSNSQFSDSEFSKWKIEVNNAAHIHSLFLCMHLFIGEREQANLNARP